MPAFTPETARAARARQTEKNRSDVRGLDFKEALRVLKPEMLEILQAGLKSRDAKIKHESMKLGLTWLERLDPTRDEEITTVVYHTAALPHELFEQDPDEIPAFVPGAGKQAA